MSWLSTEDLDRWRSGANDLSYEKLGAHAVDGGVWFCVWAPHAEWVSVIGDFNGWDSGAHPLAWGEEGLWTAFVPGIGAGAHYKYHIRRGHYWADKADPYSFALEPPHSQGSDIQGLASIVADLNVHAWGDGEWMQHRKGPSGLGDPISIYEVHLGSWRKRADGYSMTYREIAAPLAEYVLEMGFTHVEFLPLMEHPFYGSWGYQLVGYFAPTYRYGTPADLMYMIDYLHQRGIGVLLDWVPAHFATDPQGLVFFDGSPLYEYEDLRMRMHPDWGTYVFDYNKPGVRNFLISNALFWLDRYHIDGLRVDAVASMLYRDYSRSEWTPNQYGGRENLEAIDLLKRVNETVFARFPEAMMVAEESTAWPGVSQPTFNNGLGFLYKWNMGWMHDTLKYMSREAVHRKYHQNDLTFSFVYAFSEHYMLPLSHDEVVHGKGSLWNKMPGDLWQRAANLRLLYGHMFMHPGKKLLFMGAEIGQADEWNHNASVQWDLLQYPLHAGMQAWVKALNRLYTEHPALWRDDHDTFFVIDHSDHEQSVLSYVRQDQDEMLVIVLNATPVPREGYELGVPARGTWVEVLNSDAEEFGGSGKRNAARITAKKATKHGQPASAPLVLPPLGMVVLRQEKKETAKKETAKKETRRAVKS
ncbi:MAG: 1,4-alpha-glucan branching protein GlgB [Rhodothermales bacterium]